MSSPLCNATLLRVDQPPTPSPSGRIVTPTPGPAVRYRCSLVDSVAEVAWLINDLQLASTAVLYVEAADYPAAARDLVAKGQVSVQVDGDDQPRQLTIDHVDKRTSNLLGHVQLLLKEI